jgi:hypothetical protein
MISMKRPETKSTRKNRPPSGKQWPKGYTVFSQMKGRTVERIELYASPESHCVSVCFQDQTDFTVKINLVTMGARLEFVALQSDRNNGDQQVLERWPDVRSD